MSKKQNGFTAVEAVLVIVLIALLALGGWYVWQKNRNQQKGDAQKTSTTQQTQKTTAGDQKFLTIKEWGVRFKTSAGDDGAYYVMRSQFPNFVRLSTQTLKGLDQCGAEEGATTVGIYGRFKATDRGDQTDELMIDLFPDAPKVGDYYYYYVHPQAACTENDSTQAKADAAMTAFKADVETVEAIPAQ